MIYLLLFLCLRRNKMIKYFGEKSVQRLESVIKEYARDNRLNVVSVAITGDAYKEALVVFTVRL